MHDKSLASILFNTVKCGIVVIDYDTRLIVDANPAACLMFGMSRDYMINNLCSDIICTGTDSCGLIDEETIENEDITVLRKDGTIVHLLRTAHVVFWDNRKLIVENFIDVTSLKSIEVRLRQERDKAQTYLDISGSLFVALDTKGDIILINQKGCEVLGLEEKDLLGLNWFDNFISEEHRESIKGVFKKLVLGEYTDKEIYYENSIISASGEDHIIKWHNSVIYDEKGRVVSTLSSGEDITEQRHMESRLKEVWSDAEQLLSKNLNNFINNGNGHNSKFSKSSSVDLDKVLLSLTKEG